MRKIHLVLLLTAIFSAPSFADDQDMSSSDSKPCASVASACLKGGFVRSETSGSKHIWKDCMKPIILGKTVEGVTVDSATAKACLNNKIDKMSKELKEFQDAASK